MKAITDKHAGVRVFVNGGQFRRNQTLYISGARLCSHCCVHSYFKMKVVSALIATVPVSDLANLVPFTHDLVYTRANSQQMAIHAINREPSRRYVSKNDHFSP